MQEDKENILDKIYKAQEEKLDEIIKIKNKEMNFKNENYNLINLLKEEKINSEKIMEVLNKIEENYNKKIGDLIEEFYKKGFKDGVNLVINCIK